MRMRMGRWKLSRWHYGSLTAENKLTPGVGKEGMGWMGGMDSVV